MEYLQKGRQPLDIRKKHPRDSLQSVYLRRLYHNGSTTILIRIIPESVPNCFSAVKHPGGHKFQLVWLLVTARAGQLVEKITVLITGEDAEKVERVVLVLSVTVASLDIGKMPVMSIRPVSDVAFVEAVPVVHSAAVVADMMIVVTVDTVLFSSMTGLATVMLIMAAPAVISLVRTRSQRYAGQPHGQQGKQG